MEKIVLLLTLSVILMTTCGEPIKKDLSQNLKTQTQDTYQKESDAYELLKRNCYVCHNPEAASHDELIAPPLAAVKMRYSRSYPTEREFTAAVVSWVMEPREEKALMIGAVNRFNVMPKQEFKVEEIEEIALYLFQNEPEAPVWFSAHANKMHGRGMGMRRGMGYN